MLADQATGIALFFVILKVTKALIERNRKYKGKKDAEIAKVVKFSDTLNINGNQMNSDGLHPVRC